MKNTFGSNVILTVFGESHGDCIGAVLDGLPAGINVDMEKVSLAMDKRRASGNISTQRKEGDIPHFVSGIFNGKTTGTPICVIIKNENTKSGDYDILKDVARPGHADLTAEYKYNGFQDYRGGGHFSGRVTAGIVALGSIVISALEEKGIYIGSHILCCGGIEDVAFDKNPIEQIKSLKEKKFPTVDREASEKMKERILRARNEKNSVGGILQTAVCGLPKGVGEPFFDSLESVIAHGLFSVPAVKGVDFGAGFDFAQMSGAEANDEIRTDGENIYTKTNNNGGINGGISNGMPLLFRTVIKPTPSIFTKQDTVNFKTLENTEIEISGRHDPAIIHRAAVVVDSMCAIACADLLSARFGTLWLGGK